MKKISFVLLVLAFCIMSCRVAGGIASIEERKSSTPKIVQNVRFEGETNPDLVGSYVVNRVNMGQKWPDPGTFSRWEYVRTFGGPVVCWGWYDSEAGSVFRASDGYEWKDYKQDGRDCLRLEKIK